MKLFQYMAMGLLGVFGVTAVAQQIFPDVGLNDWFAPYVTEIKDWGIVSGNDDGTFAPARNINRAEFSKMLVLYDQRVDAKIAQVVDSIEIPVVSEPVLPEPTKNLPTTMKLEANNSGSNPFLCPDGWTELDLQRVWNLNSDNLLRTCITDQRCEVLTIDSRSNVSPALCPEGWAEAAYGEVNNKNSQRVCYICE